MSVTTQEAWKGMTLFRLGLCLSATLASCSIHKAAKDSSEWLPTISGQILDPSGQPAVGALVSLEGSTSGPCTGLATGPTRTQYTRTDESGQYRFEQVVPFELLVLSALDQRGGYRRAHLSELGWIGERRRRSSTTLDPLTLVEGVEIVVELFADGEPLVGVPLAPSLYPRSFGPEAIQIPDRPETTDERGRATIKVPHGLEEFETLQAAARLTVFGREEWVPLYGSLRPGEDGTEESPILTEPLRDEEELRRMFGQELTLELVDENDVPLADHQVWVAAPEHLETAQAAGSMTTDAEGLLRFHAAFAAAYRLKVYGLDPETGLTNDDASVDDPSERRDSFRIELERSPWANDPWDSYRMRTVIEVVDQLGRPVEGAVVVGHATEQTRVTDATGRVDWPWGAIPELSEIHVCHRDRGSLVRILTDQTWGYGYGPEEDVLRVRLGERYALRVQPVREGRPVQLDHHAAYNLAFDLWFGRRGGRFAIEADVAGYSCGILPDGSILMEWSTGYLFVPGHSGDFAVRATRLPMDPGPSEPRFSDLPGGQVVIDLIEDAGRIPTEPLHVVLPEEDR